MLGPAIELARRTASSIPSLKGWEPGSRLHASLSLDGTNWTKLSSIVCREKRCPIVYHHITALVEMGHHLSAQLIINKVDGGAV